MKYIKLFETTQEYTAYTASTEFVTPNVSLCEDENEVHYSPIDFSKRYLTFVAKENSTFTLRIGASVSTSAFQYISYSIDNGETWTKTNNVNSQIVTVTTPTINAGKKILWKGKGTNMSTATTGVDPSASSIFSSSGNFDIEGNIMSLLKEDSFETNNTLSNYSNFTLLFAQCTKLISAKRMVLPSMTVQPASYGGLFYGCTNLTEAPQLPATTLAQNCYAYMFNGCTSLTSAPKSIGNSATTMQEQCCAYMFSGCTSLTVAPELPAATLASYCYYEMFEGCTSLTTAPQLLATTLANYCYQNMFNGCTSLTTAPQLPSATLATSCYAYMFSGCRSLTTAPQLPATTLAEGCYYGMFSSCTSLTTAPTLSATTLATSCYAYMFRGCTSLTTAPQLPAATLADSCYSSMFYGCTSLTTAPTLSATTLAQWCYYQMFRGCTSLNSITCLATNISAYNCTTNWVNDVASNGTFTKAASMTNWTRGSDGIPTNWTVVDAS